MDMVQVPSQLRRLAWIAVSAALIGFSYWLFFSGAASAPLEH
jgi:hypothetical protein